MARLLRAEHTRAHALLASVFALAVLSLFTPLMLWVTLVSLCALAVRFALLTGIYQHPPGLRTVNLLGVLCLIALGWFSLSLGLLISMVNLLVMACALKIMMMRTRRDFLQLVISLLFLLGCGYIFHQTLYSALLYSLLLFCLLFALYSHYAPSMPWKTQARALLIMTIQCVPVTAILFFILPQLPPLWQMPQSQSTSTGLTDEITPGDIAALSQSTDLVFRATFTQPLPDKSQLYWRALTLEAFDGKTWRISDKRKQLNHQFHPRRRGSAQTPQGNRYDYQVIAESSGQKWLYALPVVTSVSAGNSMAVYHTYDYNVISAKPVLSQSSYWVTSYPQLPLADYIPGIDLEMNLQTPASGNPRTRQWVNSLMQRAKGDKAVLREILQYFTTQPFRYTLTPDTMPVDPIDTFLFDQQAGFCSHYASAMAYALRLAGIPARLVAGYQGGEPLNESVVSVYQYDAHAWVEAWLADRGWVRFDPTAMIAPDRIQFGLDQALSSHGEKRNQSPFEEFTSSTAFLQVRQLINEIDYLWSRWVLGFDSQTQTDLMKRLLGTLSAQKLTLFFLGIMALIGAILALYFLPHWQKSALPLHHRYYLKAVFAVEKYTGIPRETRPAQAYLQHVREALPSHAVKHLQILTQAFVEAEYQAPSAQASRYLPSVKSAYKQLVRGLKKNSGSRGRGNPPAHSPA